MGPRQVRLVGWYGNMTDCKHTVTQGKLGQQGSWCVGCGTKIYEVHTEPCMGCAHYRRDTERTGICRKHLMRVTANMHVTYALLPMHGQSGLCFQPL